MCVRACVFVCVCVCVCVCVMFDIFTPRARNPLNLVIRHMKA